MELVNVGTLRNIIIWVAWAAGAQVLLGAVVPLMRAGARRSDPSVAAAMFATVFAACACGVAAFEGTLQGIWRIDNATLVKMAASGLLSAFFWLCLFTSLTGGQAGRVVPVVNLSSMVVLIASFFFLGGRMGLWRLCCIVLVLLGTVLIESRSGGKQRSLLWMLYAGLAALAYAGLTLMNQTALSGAEPTLTNLVRGAVAAALLWIFAFARGKQRTFANMTAAAYLCTPLAAVACGLSAICAYRASLHGDMSMLAPITILSFAAAMLFARVALKERQPGSAVFGALLVMLGMFAIQMGW